MELSEVGGALESDGSHLDLSAAEGALDASLLLQYRRGRGERGDPAQVEGAPFALSLGAGVAAACSGAGGPERAVMCRTQGLLAAGAVGREETIVV